MGLLDAIGRRCLPERFRRAFTGGSGDWPFRMAFEHASVGIALIDRAGKFTHVNPALCQMLGYSETELLSRDIRGITHPDDLLETDEKFQSLLCGTLRSYHYSKRYIHKSGRAVWVRIGASWGSGSSGPRNFVALIEDISVQKYAEWLEHDRREILEMVAQDQALPGVFNAITRMIERQLAGMHACMLLLQEGVLHTFAPGLPAHALEAISRRSLSLASALVEEQMPPDFPPRIARIESDRAWQSVREEAAAIEAKVSWSVPLRAQDGSPVGLLMVLCPCDREARDAEIAVMKAGVHLATVAVEHHNTTRQLAHLVRHDPLTGVPNRVFYEDRLDQALGQARRMSKPLGLVALDLNRFKHINDTLGHQAGDSLLQQFALRLRGVLRECDTLARVGGDEFAIILPDIASRASAEGVIAKLTGALAASHFAIVGTEVSASSSMGLAMFPDDGSDAMTLQHKADVEMYKAKERSRSQPPLAEIAA